MRTLCVYIPSCTSYLPRKKYNMYVYVCIYVYIHKDRFIEVLQFICICSLGDWAHLFFSLFQQWTGVRMGTLTGLPCNAIQSSCNVLCYDSRLLWDQGAWRACLQYRSVSYKKKIALIYKIINWISKKIKNFLNLPDECSSKLINFFCFYCILEKASTFWKWNLYMCSILHYSRCVEIAQLCPTESVVSYLKPIFVCHGILETPIMDHSLQGRTFKTLQGIFVFSHVTCSPRFPQSNGVAEHAVHMVKNLKHYILNC